MHVFFFLFNNTATPEIYPYWHTLSLHDALPIFQNAGIVPVMTLANPAYEFHSTETPLPDIASLKGLKLRSPGDVFAEIIRGVDAIPVEVKTTDQYEALQRGLLDGSIYA